MKKLFSLWLIGLCLHAMAEQGQGGGNGGDPLELKFKIMASDLATWLTVDGAHNLILPANITSDYYIITMFNLLTNKEVVVSFTTKPVIVNGTEKVCKNFFKKNFLNNHKSPKIICNSKKFNDLTAIEQYQLVHHEYAGLAGFEVNKDGTSNYGISAQLPYYLQKKSNFITLTYLPHATYGQIIIDNTRDNDYFKYIGTFTLQAIQDIQIASQQDTIDFYFKDQKSKCQMKLDSVNYERVISAGTVLIPSNMTELPANFLNSSTKFTTGVTFKIENKNSIKFFQCIHYSSTPEDITIRQLRSELSPYFQLTYFREQVQELQ